METDGTTTEAVDTGNEEFDTAAALVRATPGDSAAWDTLEELAASSGQPDAVSELYREVLRGEFPSEVASDLAQRAVGFHEEWFSESAPVLVEVLSRVLEVDPTAGEWAFQRLTVVHTVAERWDELLALYDREIERTPDTHRRALLLEEAAQTAKDFAGNLDRAAAYLLQLFDLRPKDRSLAGSLERLLERQERYADLVRLWRGLAVVAEPEEARSLRLRIAEALFNRLERPGDALGELRDLLSEENGDPDGPMEMLERMVRDERVDQDARREALSILRDAYDATGRTTDVIGTLDEALRLATDDERVGIHRDAATRLRDSGDFDQAMEHLSSLLSLAPDDDDALNMLREVAPQTAQPGRLIDVLIQAADSASDEASGAKLRLEAVDRLSEAGDQERSIEQIERVASAEGLDDETVREAMRRHASLLEVAGRQEERLSALEKLAGVEDTRGAQRESLVAAARLARELGQPDRAIAAWESALEADPKDLWALEEIIAILEAEERHGDLVAALRRRADSGVPAFQRRSDLARIAKVQSEGLELIADGIATWNEIGAAYGEDATVVDALVDLYGRAERFVDLAELLDRAAARDDAHVSTLRALQGDTFANHLNDVKGALRAYRRALESDERHEGAREGLGRLVEDEIVGPEAVEALARSYKATDDWESLLSLLDARLEATDDVGRQLELLDEAASLQESSQENASAAQHSVRRALTLAPGRIRLENELDRLVGVTGEHVLAAEALEEAGEASEDAERAGHLFGRAATLRQAHSDNAEAAFEAALRALGYRPGRIEDAQRVVELGQAAEDATQSAAALEAAAEDANASVELLDLMATAQRQVESAGLSSTLRRLVDLRPQDLDGLVELVELAGEDEERAAREALYGRASALWRRGRDAAGEATAPEQTVAAATWLAESLEDDSEASLFMAEISRLPLEPADAATWLRRAARKANEAGDSNKAMALFREVLERTGEDAEALEALGALYLEQGRGSELLDLRRRELAVTEDPDRRVELRLDVARLVTEIEEKGGRLEALQENLRERPGHDASLSALEYYLSARRDYGQLAGVLEAQAALIEGERAASLWTRVASLTEEHIGDADRALEAYRRVVDLVPDDIPALDALARIQQERGESAAASRWLERRLGVAGEDEKADVAMSLATTLLEAGRVERACEVLEVARDGAPERSDIRALLADEYRKQDSHGPLARVLADSAERAEEREEVLQYVREAARLYRDEIGEPSAAIPVLRKARDLAPDDREIELMLAEGLRHAEEYDEAREILEKVIADFGRRRSSERAQVHYDLAIVARAQGNLPDALLQLELASKMAAAEPRVLQMLGRMAREAGELDRAEKAYRALLMTVRRRSGGSTLDVGSAEVLYELHALARERGEEEQAEELRESALEAAAQSDAEAFRFRDNLASRGEDELVIAALERRVEVASEPASKAAVLAAMADASEALGRREEALWRRMTALDHAPGDLSIHKATLRQAREDDKVAPYVTKLEELVESRRRENDSNLLATLLVQLGSVKETEVGDLDAATSLYGRAESLLESPVGAWIALARVGAAREDVPLQRRVLTQLVDAPDLSEGRRASALHQLVGIQLRDTGGLDEAVVTARRAFDLDPRHASLATILDQAIVRANGHGEALRLYEEVARDANDDLILLSFLERRAAGNEATLAQVREGVEKARALEDEARLEVLLERAAEVASASEEGPGAARAILLELSERRTTAGDAQGAIRYAKLAVETAEFDEERRTLEVQLARAAAAEGGDLELAAEVYAKLLESDPMDEAIWRPLLDVHSRRNDEARLNDLVSFLVDGLLDPGLRNEARMERAKWLMGTEGREFDAVDVLKAVLDEQPEHKEAGELLATLYEKSGYNEDLVELLERQLDVARDNQDLEQIATLTLKLGGLLEKVRREDAMDVYRRAADWVPENREIIERSLAIFGPDDDARERAMLRERLLNVETGAAASDLARELYQEWSVLEDNEAMVRTLAIGYRSNPSDDGIRSQLEAYYREAERFEDLANFLMVDAERLTDDPAQAVARLREAATIKRDTLGDASGAVELLQTAHETVGGVEILGELVVALQAAGRSDEAETTIGNAIRDYEARDEGYVHLLLSRARIRTVLERLDVAIADLEAAYEISPALAAPDLVDALVSQRDRSSAAGDSDSQRRAVLRLVVVLSSAGEKQQARDVLSHWTEVSPSDVEALEQLRDIEVGREDWYGVVNVCHRLVQVVEGAAQLEAANLLAEAADKAGSPEHARSGLEFVHASQPADATIIARLRALYEATNAYTELAALCLREAASAEDERAFELEREAGRLYVQVNDGEAALEALRRARERKPEDHETTVLLADAYMSAEYFAEAGQLLEDAIGRHTRRRSPELSELQHRMAKLARGAGDRVLEMQWLSAGLESDKNNGIVASELAQLAWEEGDADTALAALRAVTLSRTEGPMSRAKAFLMQAQIAHQRGEARRALLWARKAKSEDDTLEGVDAFLLRLGEG
ncbi:MAG: tetratricopeptide (TPR) repeat protein [Polyangiales bacterium]|jgi:tetratricopeptide (TPR) repeat protein